MPASEAMNRRPLYEQHVSGPALAAFLRVSAAWGLDEPQERMLLGQPSPETLKSWKANRTGALSLDQVERISYVLRIFRLLQDGPAVGAAEAMTGGPAAAPRWLLAPREEPIFGGRRPIDVMCLEDIRGLRQVAQFLQALVEPEPAEADTMALDTPPADTPTADRTRADRTGAGRSGVGRPGTGRSGAKPN